MSNPARLFIRQSHREWLCHVRQPRTILYSALFFLMIMVFFPLTLPPTPGLYRQIVPGLCWIALLLAQLLASERLFQQDYEEGVIEQWLTSGEPLSVIVAAKVLMQWLVTLLPLLLLCPLIAMLFGLSFDEMGILMAGLLAGSPATCFLCALANALSCGLRQKGVLVALIVLPLALPVMIFGSGSLSAKMLGLAVSGHLALLLAFSILAISLLPLAMGALIRVSLMD